MPFAEPPSLVVYPQSVNSSQKQQKRHFGATTVLGPGVSAINQQITLRTLVNDLIGPTSSSPSSSSSGAAGGGLTYGGITITTNCITKAVQNSSRNINR